VHFKLCFFPLLKYKNSSTALVIRNIVNSSAENTGSADWPVNDPLTQKSAVWISQRAIGEKIDTVGTGGYE